MAQRPRRTNGSAPTYGYSDYQDKYQNVQEYTQGRDSINGRINNGNQRSTLYGEAGVYGGARRTYETQRGARDANRTYPSMGFGDQSIYTKQARGSQNLGRSYGSVRNKREQRGKGGVLFVIIAAVLGIIIGALASYATMNMMIRVPQPIGATITADKLASTTVGTYRYNGKTYDISAYDAIAATKSLETMKNEDGTYDTPSADMVLSFARNEVLKKMVEDKGIVVSDGQIQQYAYDITGSMDMNVVAAYFDMDADQAWNIMAEAAAVKALREAVVGSGQPPAEPNYPADGNTEVGNAEYANYIIALLGSNWDTVTGTWANTDNDYYRALKDQVFAPGSANYEAADAAYGVAYSMYVANGSAMEAWTDYVNGYLDEGSITVATLRA